MSIQIFKFLDVFHGGLVQCYSQNWLLYNSFRKFFSPLSYTPNCKDLDFLKFLFFPCSLTASLICALGVLASAGPSRLSSTQISTHTLRKTARGKCVCSPPWTGWKTTCSSSLKRAYQQHQLQGKILPLRGRRTSSADCGFTVTTSTTRWRGRTSWSGPGSWVCPDSACPGSLALCVWKVLSLPARSSGPGSFDCWYFKLLSPQPEACCGVTFTIVHPLQPLLTLQSEGSDLEEDHDSTQRGHSAGSGRGERGCWRCRLSAQIHRFWRGNVWPTWEPRKSHGPRAALPVFERERLLWCLSDVFWNWRQVTDKPDATFVLALKSFL